MTFEENMKRLRDIVDLIENGQVDLDGSLELYKEAAGIISDCNKRLNQAEITVREIADNFDKAENEEE